MLKTIHLRILLLLAVAMAVPVVGFSLDSATHVWTFDDDPPESLPPEFQVGTLFDGRPAGEWKILQTEMANHGKHVLGQLLGKGAEHAYKVVLVQGTTATDLDLRVSFLPISGKADMGGGLIWRERMIETTIWQGPTRWNKTFECIGSRKAFDTCYKTSTRRLT